MKYTELKKELEHICALVDQATTLEAFYNIIFKMFELIDKSKAIKNKLRKKNSDFILFEEVYEKIKDKKENKKNEMGLSQSRTISNYELKRILREPERKKNITNIKKMYSSIIYVLNKEIKNQR